MGLHCKNKTKCFQARFKIKKIRLISVIAFILPKCNKEHNEGAIIKIKMK